jgi:uncharacterized protein
MQFVIGYLVLTLATSTAEAAEELDFAHMLKTKLEDVILPAHQAFADASLELKEPVNILCDYPSREHLETVRISFESLVLHWSKIEMYRFGPVLEANRFEKLFYWPDPRGRPLRQVRKGLDSQDPTLLNIETLAKKSVAVQGLLALKFILFGIDSETLFTGNAHRCNYLESIAGVIAINANSLSDSWQGEAGYAAEIINAGQANSLYNSPGEVVQELIKVAATQLQIVGELKIAVSIGKLPGKPKPKRAPFWRSDLTATTLAVNIGAVERVLSSGISELVAKKAGNAQESFKFELSRVKEELKTISSPWIDIVKSDHRHKVLSRSNNSLVRAIQIVQTS